MSNFKLNKHSNTCVWYRSSSQVPRTTMMGPLCRTRPECLEPRTASNQTAGAHPTQVPWPCPCPPLSLFPAHPAQILYYAAHMDMEDCHWEATHAEGPMSGASFRMFRSRNEYVHCIVWVMLSSMTPQKYTQSHFILCFRSLSNHTCKIKMLKSGMKSPSLGNDVKHAQFRKHAANPCGESILSIQCH